MWVWVFFYISVPKEKLKTHDDDEPGKKDTQKKNKSKTKPAPSLPQTQDYYFKDFRKLCLSLSQENSHLQKTSIFKEFIHSILSKGMFYKLLFMCLCCDVCLNNISIHY